MADAEAASPAPVREAQAEASSRAAQQREVRSLTGSRAKGGARSVPPAKNARNPGGRAGMVRESPVHARDRLASKVMNVIFNIHS